VALAGAIEQRKRSVIAQLWQGHDGRPVDLAVVSAVVELVIGVDVRAPDRRSGTAWAVDWDGSCRVTTVSSRIWGTKTVGRAPEPHPGVSR